MMFSPFTYQNTYPNPYSSYYPAATGNNPYQPQLRQEIAKVSGENGAKAFQLPARSSILLLDENEPIIWLKQTDDAGYPSLTAYSITPYVPEQKPDTTNLEKRIERLEALINESNFTNATEQQTTECVVTDKSDQKFSKWKKP